MNTLNMIGQANPAPISPKGKPLSFHMVDWEYLVHLDTLIMIGWSTIVVGCTKNQMLGGGHLSKYYSGSLTLETLDGVPVN